MPAISEQSTTIKVLSKFDGARKLGSISIERLDSLKKPRIVGSAQQTKVPEFFHPDLLKSENIRVTSLVKKSNTDIVLPPELAPLINIFETAAQDHYGVKGSCTRDYCYIDMRQGIVGQHETLDTFGIHSDTYLDSRDATSSEDDSYYVSSVIDTTYFPAPLQLTDEEIVMLRQGANVQYGYDKTSGQWGPLFDIELNKIFCVRADKGEMEGRRYGENRLVNPSPLTPHRSTLNTTGTEPFRTFVAIRFVGKKMDGWFKQNPALEAVS